MAVFLAHYSKIAIRELSHCCICENSPKLRDFVSMVLTHDPFEKVFYNLVAERFLKFEYLSMCKVFWSMILRYLFEIRII